MAVPDFQTLMLPLLKLAGNGEQHTLAEAVDHLAREFQLSDEDRTQLLESGQTRLYNRVGWTTTYLKKAGLLKAAGPGRFQLTERGHEELASGVTAINIAYLEKRFPAVVEFRKARPKAKSAGEEAPAIYNALQGAWEERPTVQKRVEEVLNQAVRDDSLRRNALTLFALAIETADQARGDAWFVRDTDQGLRLTTGRLLACEIARSSMRVAVVGPISNDIRDALAVDPTKDDEFNAKTIPGAVILTFPVEHALEALKTLQDGFNAFVDAAMSRVRSAVSLEEHVPEAVTHVGRVVGREMPQPKGGPDTRTEASSADLAEDNEVSASREPQERGRAPIFEYGQRSMASLMSDIEREVIALPDLQRPFVWEDTKVRDLLDSLFVGFPVGTLVLWHTSGDRDARAIGSDRLGLKATALVIDGQQRLTSLYAVMRGVEVINKDGATRKIKIAFRPRDGRFEVADAAIRKDPEFLADVTELWKGKRPKPQIRRDLINSLRDNGRVVTQAYEDAVERNLDRAHSISEYKLPTVDIRKTTDTQSEEATEEDVAEIFVRINNQGTRLGQSDFVLTLLSVYHGELRDRIEDRAREMSQGSVVGIDTQQLLRAVCGVAFDQARMSAVYRLVRGVNPNTGQADINERKRRLGQLDDAAKLCMDKLLWRDYLLRVKHAGFVSPALIASKNAIVNAYAFYLRGRNAGVPKSKLDEFISRWLFGTLLSARYSGSSETMFEQDLARVSKPRLRPDDADGFVRALDETLAETITGDYWTHSLVATLETQKARAPSALAFRAAQIVLGTRALFSDQLLQNLLDPPGKGTRAANEAHHLFPESWLNSRGIKDRRRVNQVANLAEVGWHENNFIGGHSPAEYVPRIRSKLGIGDDRWGRMCAEHALPLGWETMQYDEFLRQRRTRMADLIRVAFRQLGGEASAPPLTPPWFLPGAESTWHRIVETERGLRRVVREVYTTRFAEAAARRIEEALPESARESLSRALRARPAGSDPLTVVDFLYLAQLPPLLFHSDVQQESRRRFGGASDAKQRLLAAITVIAPIRNEIAHVREIASDRLLRASAACVDVLEMLQASSADKPTIGTSGGAAPGG